jgi:hypothetical protein
MEKSFVIECDSERSTVFVYEVDKAHERSEVIYKRPLGDPQTFNEFIGPKMYGKLQAILFSAETIHQAKPIEPQMPRTESEQAALDANEYTIMEKVRDEAVSD